MQFDYLCMSFFSLFHLNIIIRLLQAVLSSHTFYIKFMLRKLKFFLFKVINFWSFQIYKLIYNPSVTHQKKKKKISLSRPIFFIDLCITQMLGIIIFSQGCFQNFQAQTMKRCLHKGLHRLGLDNMRIIFIMIPVNQQKNPVHHKNML